MIYDPEYLDGDHAKSRQVEEAGVEGFERRARSLTSLPPRSPRENTKEDFLAEVVRENVTANNHHDD